MNNFQFFTYLLILSGSTYLIRVIPFVAIKEKIHNRFVQSMLYYLPYAVLTAMTIPGIFYATSHHDSALIGLLVAVFAAMKIKSLAVVATVACVTVYFIEKIMGF